MTTLPLVGRNDAVTNFRSLFRAPEEAEDGHDVFGLRVICQNVDNFSPALYYENDYHSHSNDFGFFLSRLNWLVFQAKKVAGDSLGPL